MQIEQIRRSIHELGIETKPQWIDQCCNAIASGHESLISAAGMVFYQYLHSDIRDAGVKSLPDNIASLHNRFIEGSFVLQVETWKNVSETSENQKAENSKRMLKFQLTDGYQDVVAFEYKKVLNIKIADLAFGLKLLVMNPYVRRGMLMLNNDNTHVLGGKICIPMETDDEKSNIENTPNLTIRSITDQSDAATTVQRASQNPTQDRLEYIDERAFEFENELAISNESVDLARMDIRLMQVELQSEPQVCTSNETSSTTPSTTHSSWNRTSLNQPNPLNTTGIGTTFVQPSTASASMITGNSTWNNTTGTLNTAATHTSIGQPETTFSINTASTVSDIMDLTSTEDCTSISTTPTQYIKLDRHSNNENGSIRVIRFCDLPNHAGSVQYVNAYISKALTPAKVRNRKFYISIMLTENVTDDESSEPQQCPALLSNEVCAELFDMDAITFKQVAKINMEQAKALVAKVEEQLWEFNGIMKVNVPNTVTEDIQMELTVMSVPVQN